MPAGLPLEVLGSNSSSGAHHWAVLWQSFEAGGQCPGACPHAEHDAVPHQCGHLPVCCAGHAGLFISQADEAERVC